VPPRLHLAVASIVLAVTALVAVAPPAAADAPTIAQTWTFPMTASKIEVRVAVDTFGSPTTVSLEYATAGAYRAAVPSAATTVVLGTLPGSSAGVDVLQGYVSGLEPGSTYRMRVTAQNADGTTQGADLEVRTPAAPRITFRAKLRGQHETSLVRLAVSRLVGHETIRITCRDPGKGCPLSSETLVGLTPGRTPLTMFPRRSAMQPGARVTVLVTSDGTRLARLVLTMRDGKPPKVRRG
jgi:hypothetical protein